MKPEKDAASRLAWTERARKPVFKTAIFSVCETECESPEGGQAVFSVLECNPWALVMPLIRTERGEEFVMVRQWRHGLGGLSVEFPGGVVETGEDSAAGARRELREETGYRAKKLTLLGKMNPNPAFMGNTISFFLAEELEFEGDQKLDKDEFVNVETHPVDEVLRNMGEPPYSHALMAAALSFWHKHKL
jgi:8-oxo-dGTP pyrophosphatase MutT (NUDIX family)